MEELRCRFCARPLSERILDLGTTPLANSLIKPSDVDKSEPRFPLELFFCGGCFLVQVGEVKAPEGIFSDYLYFSSFSSTWVEHARTFAAEMIPRLGLGPDSKVVEIASNDGYLLQWFRGAGIPVLGIEPAKNVAQAAITKGIPTESDFFGKTLAEKLAASGVRADLIVANNVLAHVPDIDDFVSGFPLLLSPQGVLSIEFPHLLNLVCENQFDTIYHEHYSYLSVLFVSRLFERHGLRIFEIEKLPTHGGSLRVLACRSDAKREPENGSLQALLAEESAARLDQVQGYSSLERSARSCRDGFNAFLSRENAAGKNIAGYGAPAKGNTFLNYCGVTSAQIPYTVDRNPHKQGCLLPGSRIPVRAPETLIAARPDFVVILPWNLRTEIAAELAQLHSAGTKFATAIPRIEIF